MFAVAGGPSIDVSALDWSRLFALQPEPDLEFTEEELEQATPIRSTSPVKRPKKSGGRPLLWILLLALAGGAVYVAMEPEMILDLLGPLLGEESLSPEPTAAVKPAAPASPLTPKPAVPAPTATAPTTPAAPPPAPAAGIPAPAPSPIAAAPPAMPTPMFGEGQKVTVSVEPGAPPDGITLMQDAAGTKPGPTVRPGTTLTVLDGDLQGNSWVYSVRGDDGTKGWVAERKLRLKP